MYRVLIVEDDPDINLALHESMRRAGYDAAGVLTGEDALEQARRRRPDLVLLDQMLPDIEGEEVCRQLRASTKTKGVPIIFVTARAGERDRVRGLGAGADDYVVKPFSTEELLLRVGGLLRRSSSPSELRLPASWLHCREQYRVWDNHAKLHLERGEWAECREISLAIVNRCGRVLSAREICRLYARLAQCAGALGDRAAERTWEERAQEQARFG